MDELRKKARELRKKGKYKDAISIYESIITDENNIKLDKWLGWEYADSLKKDNKVDEAINICKLVYLENKSFKYNNDLLAWCLYEKYIKNNINNTSISKKEEVANFITVIVEQDKNKTPYLLTIFNIIDYYKEPFNAEKIVYWLEKLDPNAMDDNTFIIKDKKRNIEISSQKEKWYYLYCKSLFKLQQYENCIQKKEEAFLVIKKFHNNHDLWLNRMEAVAYQQLGNNDKALELMEELLKITSSWIIYSDISNIYYINANINKAIVNNSKALIMMGELNKKINVIEQMGKILLLNNKLEEGYKHFLLALEIRQKEQWNVPSKLIRYINKNRELYIVINLKSELNNIWIDYILKEDNRYTGKIINISSNKKYGFINSENKNYYFSIKSIFNKRNLYIGNEVSFILDKGFDVKKNRESLLAKEIVVLGD